MTVAHFWTGLVLLGIGWNFAFIGATTMVTQCHRPEERNTVQAFNDFLIFGSMAIELVLVRPVAGRFRLAGGERIVFPAVLVAGALLAWLAPAPRAGAARPSALRQADTAVETGVSSRFPARGRHGDHVSFRDDSRCAPAAFWLYPRVFRSG